MAPPPTRHRAGTEARHRRARDAARARAPAARHQGDAREPAEGRAPPRREAQGAGAALLQQPLRRRPGRAPRALEVDRYGKQVFVDAHWIKSVGRYQAITRGVSVDQSPTVVIIDRNLKAETLVGYVDEKTIDQAVVDALRSSGGSAIKDPYFRQIDAVCVSAKQRAKALRAALVRRAVPAYLAGLHAISVDGDAKAAGVKAPKKHAGFAQGLHAAGSRTPCSSPTP